MDDQQGELDCIAVGSTGTLLSLMGKEMEILQARRSCSVSNYNNNMKYKNGCLDSTKDANTHHELYNYNSNIIGSPSALMNDPPSTSIVSSLWSDLKGLLRSPTNSTYHNSNAHDTPLISHHFNNTLFCIKEQYLHLHHHDSCDHALDCIHQSPSQPRPHSHPPSPLRSFPSPNRPNYLKKALPHEYSPAPPPFRSPPSKQTFPKEASAPVLHSCPSQKPSLVTYPKEKVAADSNQRVSAVAISYSNQKSALDLRMKADYPHGKSPLHNNCSNGRSAAAGAAAAGYPNRKSPLHYHSQERSDIANRTDTDVYQVTPTGINQETTRKGNQPAIKEGSLAAAAAAKHLYPTYPKGKNMDAASPNLQYPTNCPKTKGMDAVYAMRRSTAYREAQYTQSSKLLQEVEAKEGRRISCRNSACSSRKREERAMSRCSNSMQDELVTIYRMQKREERGYVQNESACMQKREEREGNMQEEYSCRQRREESVYGMQEYYECCMQKPMLEDGRGRGKGSFTPSRSFEGRSLPLVSVVDLQCCHSPDPSSRRLSFTRLSSF